MSTPLQTIEGMLPGLSPGEKAQLLQWLARDLGGAAPGIERTPSVCGGAARIVRTRIPVWTLEQARRLGTSEADILRCYPTLRAEDISNAWAYVRMNRDEIDRDIMENEEGLVGKLVRINRELDGTFDTSAFEHRAVYNQELGRIEMYLVSRARQLVRVGGGRFVFEKGECIYTEASHKYTLEGFAQLARESFSVERVWTDERCWFSLQYLQAR